MAKIQLPPSRAKLVKAPAGAAVKKTNGSSATKQDFKVKDLSLADWGRKTIDVSEQEMPGLMSIRKNV